MTKALKTLILVRIMRNVKECGINTEQKKTMDFANLVSNKMVKKRNKSSWIKTEIILMIAKQKIVQKI